MARSSRSGDLGGRRLYHLLDRKPGLRTDFMTLQELFADPKRWTKGAFAKDASGDPVRPNSKDAVCWCLSGGVHKCYSRKDSGRVFVLIRRRLQTWITPWNDAKKRTIKQVQKLVNELGL